MRIVAGVHGGRRIVAPPGDATRPTSDRVREALFSILGDIEGARVLDLFAGSGALGLEALSRGAASARFVDKAPKAITAVKENCAALSVDAEIERVDWRTALKTASERGDAYDLAFVDPPYRHAPELGRPLSEALRAVLAPQARIVTESDRRAPLELDTPPTDERRYGDTLIRIYDT